ncbi:NAD(P)-binding domain-containing protein [uncultured Roseobacter sp.]|nr:NAD(P)-binding domain-containing protein [uncultured Roseobacter sp.]
MKIAILGRGAVGKALAKSPTNAGHEVIYGSRG